jgi:hypothetical protein
MLIAGNNELQTFIEHTGLSSVPHDPVRYKKAVSNKYGIALVKVSIFFIADNSNDAKRIMEQDEFTLQWDGINILGISFAVEDNKKYLIVTANKQKILNNNIAISTITFKIFNSDRVTIDTAFNDTKYIECNSPKNKFLYKLIFVNGVCEKQFKSDVIGEWNFPTKESKKINGFKSKQSDKETINVFME